jgi:glycosyltransferase involved in cell wall biosynthesis
MPNIPVRNSVPVVLFEHNVEYVIWKRQSEVESRRWRRALLEFEWRKILRYESSACARAQLTLTVSDVDRALLAQQVPHAAIRSIRTGVDTSYFAPNGTAETPSTLVFTGAMDWYPNEDAMLYFIESVFPMIRSRISDVSLSVVGRNPSRRLRQVAEHTGVTVTGIVEDIRPYVAQAAVYIVPLRVGGGTRLKIFEACAMGKAVVSTAVGAEGLPLIPGVHFIEANDAEKFALEVVSLLQNPEHRRALGTAARRLVEEQYSWASVGREFEARCKEVLNHAN